MKSVVLAAATAALLFGAAGVASAAVVVPVSAVASSSFPGYPSSDAIDQDAGYTVSDWASNSQGVLAFLNVDLGAVYTLDTAFVTDRVTSGGANNGFVGGLSDFTTRFSLQAFTDSSFTTAFGSAFVVDHPVPGVRTQPSNFQIAVNLGGLQTQFIQYRVLQANGVNTGLSDLRFEGQPAIAAVPEPATWALMILGFGSAGAMLRRRGARIALSH